MFWGLCCKVDILNTMSEWVSESRSDVSNSLWPNRLYSPRNSPGQNMGMGSLFLLQGIFPTQVLNPGIPHCRQILYQGNPWTLWWTYFSLKKKKNCKGSSKLSYPVMSNLCNPMDCSTPGFPAHHQFPEPSQTHVHRVGDAVQPSHPLSSPYPLALSLSQGLFKRVSSLNQVTKVLEFQLQHQFFHWIFRIDFL